MYNWPHRKPLRLKKYDYSNNWYYFITICTKLREEYFGKVLEWKMILSEYGRIVENEILKTGDIRYNVEIDNFIIMPNHLHLIVVIQSCRERLQSFPTVSSTHFFGINGALWLKWNHISSIIRGLKGTITKQINSIQEDFIFAWQKSFFDKIIKNNEQLEKTRKYIINNPLKWELDINNPINIIYTKPI